MYQNVFIKLYRMKKINWKGTKEQDIVTCRKKKHMQDEELGTYLYLIYSYF